MNTENIVTHLRVLWRTDRIIADIRMQHPLVSMGLRALAALIAAFGLLMLELVAYFALVQFWNAISAAARFSARSISRLPPLCSQSRPGDRRGATSGTRQRNP